MSGLIRSLASLGLGLSLACASGAGPSEDVSTVASARELPLAAFDGKHGFSFEGQIVSIGRDACVLFDRTGGERLRANAELLSGVAPGDVCRVFGVLRQDSDRDRHYVVQSIVRTGYKPPPPVLPLSAEEIGLEENRYRTVLVRGVVESVFRDEFDCQYLWFVVRSASGLVTASIPESGLSVERMKRLIDAEVQVCAQVMPYSSVRRHLGAHLSLSGGESLRVLEPACEDPFAAPPYRATDDLHRRRATGRVLASSATRFFLNAGDWDPCLQVCLTPTQRPPVPGRRVTVVGFTHRASSAMLLANAVYRDEGEGASAEDPVRDIGLDALFHTTDNRDRMDSSCNGTMIRTSGTIRRRTGDSQTVSVVSDRHDVLVDLSADDLGALRQLRDGTVVEITGLCIAEPGDDMAKIGLQRSAGFTLFPRRTGDLRIISLPPWWTRSRLSAVLAVAGALLVVILVWNGSLRLLAERRGRELAAGNVARAEAEMRTLERTRLSAELHDSIAQNLTLAAFEIDSAAQRAETYSDGVLMHKLEIAGRTVKSCNRDLRGCLWDLRNDTLDIRDMTEAIRRTLVPYVRGVQVNVRVNIPRERLTDTTAQALYRIVRELVINAIKHGGATEVRVAGSIEGATLLLSVRDNGCGFDPADSPGVAQGHFGFQGVCERARRLDGGVTVESAAGKGARVVVRLKLAEARAAVAEGRT